MMKSVLFTILSITLLLGFESCYTGKDKNATPSAVPKIKMEVFTPNTLKYKSTSDTLAIIFNFQAKSVQSASTICKFVNEQKDDSVEIIVPFSISKQLAEVVEDEVLGVSGTNYVFIPAYQILFEDTAMPLPNKVSVSVYVNDGVNTSNIENNSVTMIR